MCSVILLERVHAKSCLHAGGVGQESGDCRFKEEAECENVVPHALLEQRVTARFANDQIGPLDDDNRYEKGRVTSVLELLTGVVRLHTEKETQTSQD